MQKKFLFLAFLLTLGFTQISFSQSISSTDTYSSPSVDKSFEVNEDWSFYSDEDNKLFYIDFENISTNLSDIVVKDGKGKVIFKEDVFDLPVNTIYELDFSDYSAGDYEVELRSFTKVMRKTITIKK
jgi:hypothetical protein